MSGSYVQILDEFPFEEQIGNSLVVREPVGVVGCITPWNYPLHQIVAKVAPGAGRRLHRRAEAERGRAAQRVHPRRDPRRDRPARTACSTSCRAPARSVGEAIAAHPDVDMVSFTGSTRAGKRVSQVAAETVKRVALELGGKSANIILDDLEGEELDKAVRAGVGSCYLNSGQTCTAFTRMLVPAAKQDEIVDIIRDEVENTFTIGDPATGAGRLGPLISDAQRTRVRGYIQKGIDEGATLVTGGAEQPEDLPKGYYVKPTVFSDVSNDMTIAQEEIFGPVLSVIPYEDEEDAVRIANDTVYGLSGGVWGADAERAQVASARRIRTGQLEINGGGVQPVAPFGGYKQSGNGRELGKYGLEEFLAGQVDAAASACSSRLGDCGWPGRLGKVGPSVRSSEEPHHAERARPRRRHRGRRPDRLQPAVPHRQRRAARPRPAGDPAAARDHAGPRRARRRGHGARRLRLPAARRHGPDRRRQRGVRRRQHRPARRLPAPHARAWSAATCSRPTAPSSPPRARRCRDSAADDVRILVVGNPANTNALIAMNNAPNIAHERFTAMTRLDHNRAMAQLAAKAGATVTDITQMTIWGNHSATQYPDLFHAEVGGKNAAEVIGDQGWIEDTSSRPCRSAAPRSSRPAARRRAASAANAAIDHVHDWVLGTADGDWVSMGVPSDGSYGVPEGLMSSFPCTCADGEWSIVQGLDIDDFSRGRIDASVAELAEERDAVEELGLIG